jgi:predicted lipid-binding transport protein (Tim44 family)
VFSAQRLEPFVRQAVASAPAPARQPSQDAARRSSGRDSIWNGGLIGAAIGGVGGSALIVASSGGSDNIPRAMLNVCVAPALAGFAVGAIIDALH